MLNEKELQEILTQGENSSVEFKSVPLRPEALAREIVAFANTNGGVILLGVNDSGKIEGLDSTRNYEEWAMNIARNNVSPAIAIEYETLQIQNTQLGCISVQKGLDKPYQTADQYYLRVGSTNRRATQTELLRLFQAAGLFHYDNVAVPRTAVKEINLSKIDQYFLRYDIDFSAESDEERRTLLTNTDILTDDGEVTVGGLLIFGLNPSRYLPQCGISFAHFTGVEIDSDLLDKQNIDGTLDFQVDTGLAVIKNNLRVPSKIVASKRQDTQVLPLDKVFRELLVNSCVHRDYSIVGSKIRIFMFADRLEFITPGRLPNTVTIEKLKAGVSYARNPILVKFMENLRYIDRLGRGLPMVWREMQKIGGSVEFKELGEEFKVTLQWKQPSVKE